MVSTNQATSSASLTSKSTLKGCTQQNLSLESLDFIQIFTQKLNKLVSDSFKATKGKYLHLNYE